MANSYNISMAPAVAAVQAVVDNIDNVSIPACGVLMITIDTVVDAIRAVDVVNLAAQNTAIDTVVDAIRATDITTITNAITAKNVRGQFKKAHRSTTTTGFEDLINIASGSGKLVSIMYNGGASTTNKIRITIDGILSNTLTFPFSL